MSDTDDPLLGYIVGGIFGAILIILIVGYFYNKKKQNNSSIRMRPHNNDSGRGTSTKVMPTPTTAAAAQIPHKIRMRRRATHDENDDQPRRVIERTRAGIELIFSEFDQSDDQMIDLREVRFLLLLFCVYAGFLFCLMHAVPQAALCLIFFSFFYLKPKRPDIFFRIHTAHTTQFKALVATLAARQQISPNLLPNKDELEIIFEALDDDNSGGLSLDEWNHWVVDGLEQAPSEREEASRCGNELNQKMDMLLSCLEQFGIEAGALLSKASESEEQLATAGNEVTTAAGRTSSKESTKSLFEAGKDKQGGNGKEGDSYKDWN